MSRAPRAPHRAPARDAGWTLGAPLRLSVRLLLGAALLGACLIATPSRALAGCQTRAHGPQGLERRRAATATLIQSFAHLRRTWRSHQIGLLDWDMRNDVTPGMVAAIGTQSDGSTVARPTCPTSGDAGPLPLSLNRGSLSAQFGDPSTPFMLRLSTLGLADAHTADGFDPGLLAHLRTETAVAELKVLHWAEIAVGRAQQGPHADLIFTDVSIPRLHAGATVLASEAGLRYLRVGLLDYPIWRRLWVTLDADVGYIEDEDVGFLGLALEHPILGGRVVPRLSATGEIGQGARLRTASAGLTAVIDATHPLPGTCPLLCYLVVGLEADGAVSVSDPAFLEGITGARHASGYTVGGGLVLGFRLLSLRVGAWRARNRFDALTRLPDAVDRDETGYRADLRFGL